MSDNTALWWHRPITRPAVGVARRLIVVTDIDRSLLEPGRRSLSDERAALDFLAARGIPLVINSSRTRAEIERLHRTLQMLTPFISECGSAVFVPDGCSQFASEQAKPAVGGKVIEFGKRYHVVVDELRLAAQELDINIVSFADLAIEDVARELGIPMVDAQLAKLREYTELFRIADDTDARRSRLYKALRRRGLRCWWTGSHHLVTATPDRSESLRLLKTLWKGPSGDPIIIGLGDSDDDAGWLSHTDIAVVVQDHRTGAPVRILSKLPTVRVTRWPGRRGWSEAVVDLVNGLLSSRETDSRQPQWPPPTVLHRSIQPS